MHRQNRLAFLNIKLIQMDCICIAAAYYLSYFLTRNFFPMDAVYHYFWLLLVFMPFWALLMFVLRMYDETTFLYTDRVVNSVILSSGVSGIVVSALVDSIKETMFSMPFYCAFLFMSTVLVIAQRLCYIFYLRKNRNRGGNALVIGSPALFEKFQYYIQKTRISFNIVGFIHLNRDFDLIPEPDIIDDDVLYDFLRNNIVDEIILAMPNDSISRFEKYVRMFEEMGITVRVLMNLYELEVAKVHVSAIGTIPMVTYHTVSLNTVQLSLKRCMDIIGSVIGLAITALLAVFIMPAIAIESKGPVIFRQKRVGTRGRVFNCYKFRSMYIDAEERKKEMDSQNQIEGGYMFKVKDDPRVTKVGNFLRKTSLDEFPQFLNVLKGDMSLVGTRPPTLGEVEKYKNSQRRRISIKPGITGMWQINGRSTIRNFDEVVKLDTSYIDNWSLWLDIKILLKTLVIVIQRTGAL